MNCCIIICKIIWHCFNFLFNSLFYIIRKWITIYSFSIIKSDNSQIEFKDPVFDLAKKKELPSDVMEILEQFGIAPEKATYVCEIITEEHKILYQFSYRMAGNILKERENWKI